MEAVDFSRLVIKVPMTDNTKVKVKEKTPKKVRQLTIEVTPDGKIRLTTETIKMMTM